MLRKIGHLVGNTVLVVIVVLYTLYKLTSIKDK